jgi:hypothetical protein
MDNSQIKQPAAQTKEEKILLDFVEKVQVGKYTATKPELVQITYRRVDIQEQSDTIIPSENFEGALIFGTSY